MVEKWNGVFIGTKGIFIGTFKTDNNGTLFVHVQTRIPFYRKWIPIGGNLKDKVKVYFPRKICDFNKGFTERECRVLPWDLFSGEFYKPLMNTDVLNKMESLELDNNYLNARANEAENYTSFMGLKDFVREREKNEYDFYVNELKPDFNPALAQGKKDEKKK